MKNIIVLIDNALEELFDDSGLTFHIQSQDKFSFQIPQKKWIDAREQNKPPAINIYLFDIQEVKELKTPDYPIRSVSKENIIHKKSNAYIDLFYIITVYGQKDSLSSDNPLHRSISEQEHQLLGELLKVVLNHDFIPKEYLYNDAYQPSLPKIFIELIQAKLLGSESGSQIWSALDQYLKPALYLKVTVPIDIDKKIESAMVVSKMMRFGIPSSEHYYSLAIRPSIINNYAADENIDILKLNLTKYMVTNQEIIDPDTKIITLYENDNIKNGNIAEGDILMIIDEHKTEFIKINSIDSSSGIQLKTEENTLYGHKIGTEMIKIDIDNAQSLNNIHFVSVPNKDRNELKIFGDDVKELQKDDLICLKDDNQIEYFQIIKKSELDIDILDQHLKIGGIVTKKKDKVIPIKDATVILKNDKTTMQTKTTGNGHFTFNDLDINSTSYKITVQASGYKEKTVDLSDLNDLSIQKMIIDLQPI